MQIRPAQPGDAAALNELFDQLGYPQDDIEATAARVKEYAADPTNAAYVADAEGNLLGMIAVHVGQFLHRDGRWGRIDALVVSADARRQGVGARLVAEAEAFATSHGCVRIELNSADHREAAHKFYERCGYVNQTGFSTRFLKVG
ncbi:GNAT family N-acetyltransferase [Kribbella sp. NPDC026611]|uniref:GNAT family N-acetyltransferase n=1 Tax=Kribbella sp. NPDC026611 TaxID=3154911 RepID=UPI0033ED1E95